MWSPTSRVGIIEPEGILNAWTTKVRIRRARRTATRIASMYSRTTDFLRTLGTGCVSAAVSTGVRSAGGVTDEASLGPEHGEEGFLGDLHAAELLHPLLALFLALQELALPG